MFGLIVPAAYLHFSAAITEQAARYRIRITAFYIIFLAFGLVASLTPYFITKLEPILGFNYWPVATPLLLIYLFFFFICIINAFYILFRKYRESEGTMRIQIKYVALGTAISIVSGYFNFLPWFRVEIPPFTNALVPAYVLLMSSAIIKYELMNIKVIVKNILFYFGISFTLYVLFYSIALSYKFLFGDALAVEGYLFGLFLSPLLGIIMYKESKVLSYIINKYVFYDAYNYRRILKSSAAKLNGYVEINALANIAIDSINKAFAPETSDFFLAKNIGPETLFKKLKTFSNTSGFAPDYNLLEGYFKDSQKIIFKDRIEEMLSKKSLSEPAKEKLKLIDKEMAKCDISLCVPFLNKGQLAALITIGPKSKGDFYAPEDFEFLELLAGEIRVAMENTLLYEEIKEKNIYLQELLNAKNDFLRIANHQLNTPLSIMKHAYSMVKDGSLSLKNAVYYWGNGLERMSSVLREFWTAFQLDESKITPKKTDIFDLIQKIVKEKKKSILVSDKKITISVEKPAQNYMVWCDPEQMEQVIENLLDNAISYNQPNGKVFITSGIYKNEYLKVSIEDTGIGFPKEEEQKIGQKFYRGKDALLAHPDGSGLGLYICKKIIEKNRGLLMFESKGQGQGSIFSFALPLSN